MSSADSVCRSREQGAVAMALLGDRTPPPDVAAPPPDVAAPQEQLTLKRELGLFSAVSLIISVMIGAGIFVSPSSSLVRAGSVGEALIVWTVCGGISLLDSDGRTVSLIVKVKGEKNKFIISVKNSLASVHWDGISSGPLKPEYLVNLESNENPTCINDGKCDPSNRLWAGTMAVKGKEFELEKGSVYLLHHDKKVVKHLSKISISNGLAWSLDKKKFYYIDSLKYRIDSYDYDDINGSVSNEKTIFCFKENKIEGTPDGMTIDSEGMLWVACWKGAQVLRIDPNTGELKFTLKLPSYQITSVCFGGPQLEDLSV